MPTSVKVPPRSIEILIPSKGSLIEPMIYSAYEEQLAKYYFVSSIDIQLLK